MLKMMNKNFGSITIVVEPHVSEKKCRQEMASQGVIDCRKINPNQKDKPAVTMILAFTTDRLPEKLTVGYNICTLGPTNILIFSAVSFAFVLDFHLHVTAHQPSIDIAVRISIIMLMALRS